MRTDASGHVAAADGFESGVRGTIKYNDDDDDDEGNEADADDDDEDDDEDDDDGDAGTLNT